MGFVVDAVLGVKEDERHGIVFPIPGTAGAGEAKAFFHSPQPLAKSVSAGQSAAAGRRNPMVIETPLGWAQAKGTPGNSYSALWSISGKSFPAGLAAKIGAAWKTVTAQPARPLDVGEIPETGTGS